MFYPQVLLIICAIIRISLSEYAIPELDEEEVRRSPAYEEIKKRQIEFDLLKNLKNPSIEELRRMDQLELEIFTKKDLANEEVIIANHYGVKCSETYRCNGEGYLRGCGCWTHKKIQENGTTVYKFHKYLHSGTDDITNAEDNAILKACDKVSHPEHESYTVTDRFLINFAHCVKVGKIQCFCSSEPFMDKFAYPPKGSDELEILPENHCTSKKLANGAVCWDYDYDNVRSRTYTKLYKLIFKIKADNITEVDDLKTFCKNEETVLSWDQNSIYESFGHCVYGGKITCFCEVSLRINKCKACFHVFDGLKCGAGFVRIQERCVKQAV